jgi:hypothetical protein
MLSKAFSYLFEVCSLQVEAIYFCIRVKISEMVCRKIPEVSDNLQFHIVSVCVSCSEMIANNSKLTEKKVKLYLPSLRMKVPDHVYVFGSLLLQ